MFLNQFLHPFLVSTLLCAQFTSALPEMHYKAMSWKTNPRPPGGWSPPSSFPATLSEKMVLFHQLPNFPSLASYWNFTLKGYQLFPNWQIQMPCLRPYFAEQFHCPPPPFWNAFISLFSRLLRYGPSWFVEWLISFALQMYGFIPSNGL